MMVGVFDRVFEAAPVFRAEKHNTKRHLNEYTSLDFEMGYIDSFEDIMEMETGFLQYTMELLQKEYKKELDLLKVTLPKVDKIPQVRFDKAKELVAEKYNRTIRNPFDLEPEEEALIGQYFKEEMDADFVFVTHYPSKKRPFYAMDDPEDTTYTLSFDLLFHGLEITTGGQRIHCLLYTSNGNKQDKLVNERKRYFPWQSTKGVYGGSVKFETEGKSYQLNRVFGKKDKDDIFELYDLSTNLPCEDFSENIGVELFGIDAASFGRTVFLSQKDLSLIHI